jgi:large subunit ribosomal protein L21
VGNSTLLTIADFPELEQAFVSLPFGDAKPLAKFRPSAPVANAAEKGFIMYAVIRTGGKQYSVAPGQILEVEKLEGAVGDTITLTDVLLVADGDAVTIGQPVVEGASVSAKITGQYRGNKIIVFRYRPKKRIRVRRGHRQWLTRLQIEGISH